jgi:hypothetical protein
VRFRWVALAQNYRSSKGPYHQLLSGNHKGPYHQLLQNNLQKSLQFVSIISFI